MQDTYKTPIKPRARLNEQDIAKLTRKVRIKSYWLYKRITVV